MILNISNDEEEKVVKFLEDEGIEFDKFYDPLDSILYEEAERRLCEYCNDSDIKDIEAFKELHLKPLSDHIMYSVNNYENFIDYSLIDVLEKEYFEEFEDLKIKF